MSSSAEIAEARESARWVVRKILRDRPDDVDDVLQDACVRAWSKRSEFRRESRYSTWFVRIAINSALAHLRRRFVSRPDVEIGPGDDFRSSDPTPEDVAIAVERYEKLYAAIDTLSTKLSQSARRTLRGESALTNTEKSTRFRMRRKLGEILRSFK